MTAGLTVSAGRRSWAAAGYNDTIGLGIGEWNAMNLSIESQQEEDGRWLAEVPELPGVLAYGASRDEALARAQMLAFRVLADRLEHGERSAESISISIAA